MDCGLHSSAPVSLGTLGGGSAGGGSAGGGSIGAGVGGGATGRNGRVGIVRSGSAGGVSLFILFDGS